MKHYVQMWLQSIETFIKKVTINSSLKGYDKFLLYRDTFVLLVLHKLLKKKVMLIQIQAICRWRSEILT